MNATTPLWVTILLAVLAPVLTLFGVLWTQRAADRRAEREARLRLDHEVEMLWNNWRFEAYLKLYGFINEAGTRPWDVRDKEADEGGLLDAVMHASLVASRNMLDATSELMAALQKYNGADPADQAVEQEVVDASNRIALIIQHELRANAPEPRVQKLSLLRQTSRWPQSIFPGSRTTDR